jgi:hypothetical protein
MFKDKSNCQIFSGSLFDDIASYRLLEYGNNLKIDYSNNTELNYADSRGGNSVTIDIDNLTELIGETFSYWKPVFVSDSNSKVRNKIIENFSSMNKPRLGIENFIKFNPQFKNFTVTAGTEMSVDWLLNTGYKLFSGTACYGILCWARKSPVVSGKLSTFPNGARVRHVTGKQYIKLNDGSEDLLVDVNADDSKLETDEGTFSFNYGSAKQTLLEVGEDLFYLVDRLTTGLLNDSSGNPVELWIPDGDFFTYKDFKHTGGQLGLKNYISPTLYSSYNRIYNALTLRYDKPRLEDELDLVTLRTTKRIAQALATSPITLDIPENFLVREISEILSEDGIRGDDFLDSTQTSNRLYNTLTYIYKKVEKLNPVGSINNRTLNHNLITSKSDLFNKLVSKYQPYLNIKSNTTVTYNKTLYNPNIFISQDISNECSRGAQGQVSNNQRINFGNVSVETKLSSRGSFIELKHGDSNTILPTADVARRTPEKYTFSIGTNQTIPKGESEIAIEGVSETKIEGVIPTFLWEVQSVPEDGCAKFSDFGKDRFKKFATSNSDSPTVYVTEPGNYVVSCTVSTPYGVLYQEKTITKPGKNVEPPALLPAKESVLIPDALKANCPNLTSCGIGQVIGLNTQTGLNTYTGLFWPISTDMQVSVLKAAYDQDFDSLGGDEKYSFGYSQSSSHNETPILSILYKPGTTTIKLKSYTFSYGRTSSSIPGGKIVPADNCQSFFERRTLSTTKTGDSAQSFVESRYSPDGGITLKRFGIFNGMAVEMSQETFDYPTVGNTYMPQTPAYGGWDPSIVSGRRLPQHSDFFGVKQPASDNNTTSTSVVKELDGIWRSSDQSVVKGYDFTKNAYIKNDKITDNKTDSTPIVFYQRDYTSGHVFNCKKVVFEPDQGIVVSNTGMFCPFLKFNPAGRTTRTFQGLGIVNLNTNYIEEGRKIKPKVFSSSIRLTVDSDIQKEPIEGTGDAEQSKRMRNDEEKKELADHDDDYGYRHLSRGYATMGRFPNGDEYGIEGSFENQIDMGVMCQDPTINYVAAVRGVPKFPTEDRNGLIIQQGGEIAKASINGLEVRLKFLNYVNPKDLIIWLDVNPSARDKQRINGADSFAGKKPPQCPIRGDRFHPDESCESLPIQGLSDLELQHRQDDVDLINNNVHDTQRDSLRLYLTYKDTIETNTYNFTVVFSDDAPVKNRLHTLYNNKSRKNADENNSKSLVADDTEFFLPPKFPAEYPIDAVKNNGKVRPTTSVPEKNDNDSQYHRTQLDINNKNYTNISLSKFQQLQLFAEPVVEGGKPVKEASSSTSFTLNIAVADEPDNMRIYDTLKDNEVTTGFISSEVTPGSTDITGSLCAWDLIIHTQPQKAPEQGDALGMVDYSRPASFGGFTFKLDTPSTALIPEVNVNAPYTYLDDVSRCIIPDTESIDNPHMWPIRFPSEAIVYMIAASAAIAGFAFAGLGGLFAGMAVGQVAANLGYQAIFDYFGQLRQTRLYEGVADFLYSSIYNDRVFGGPAKAIISFSVSNKSNQLTKVTYAEGTGMDSSRFGSISPVPSEKSALDSPRIWYKAEASIYKYKNLPILKNKTHDFMQLTPKFTRAFSSFDYEVIEDPFTKILNNNTIEHLKADIEENESIDGGKGFRINNDGEYDRGNITDFPGFGKDRILTEDYDGSDQYILIRSRIPYDVFEVGDDICLFTNETADKYKENPDDEDSDLSKTIILSKNLYNIDNTWHTLLAVPSDADVSSFNKMFMSDDNSDRLYLIFDRKTTTDQISQKAISHWGLDLENGYIDAGTPELTFSTTAPGNYGSSSPLVNKRVLSENYSTNQLQTIYDLFDNSTHTSPNNIQASGRIASYNTEGGYYAESSLASAGLSIQKAFGYSFNESNKILYGNSIAEAIASDATDLNELEYDTYKFKTWPEPRNVTEYGTSFMYARGRASLQVDTFVPKPYDPNDPECATPEGGCSSCWTTVNGGSKLIPVAPGATFPGSDQICNIPDVEQINANNPDGLMGILTIDGVYERVIPVYCSEQNKTVLNNRLTALTRESNVDESFIGDVNNHEEVIDFGSITEVTKHLNALPDDPDTCFLLKGDTCYKKETKQKLYELYRERNMILEALDNPMNATKDSAYYELNINYTDEGVIDNIDFETINDNSYLINIDPKQGCSQDNVNSTRIWLSTEYSVIDAYGGGGGDNFSMVNNFDVKTTPEGLSPDVYYHQDGTKFVFSNPKIFPTATSHKEFQVGSTTEGIKPGAADILDTQKWKVVVFNKTFMMPDDGNENLRYKRVDVKEKYVVAKPEKIESRDDGIFGDKSTQGDRVMNTIDLSGVGAIDIKFLRIPRKLKHIDYYHDKYFPDEDGVPRLQKGVVKDRMNIYYNEVYWLAVRGDTYQHTELPDFYKLMNEMTYRCFYSSIDGIEHKQSSLEAHEFWQWIPYEYEN